MKAACLDMGRATSRLCIAIEQLNLNGIFRREDHFYPKLQGTFEVLTQKLITNQYSPQAAGLKEGRNKYRSFAIIFGLWYLWGLSRSVARKITMAVSEHRSHSPDRHVENLHFNEAEDRVGFVIREGKEVVNIFPSRSGQRAQSSKLKFRNFVDYQWDYDHGNGRLISTHYSGKFIAYVVKVSGVGAIRVIDLETNERGLMKGHKGLIKDLEFMHKADQLILGYVDDVGSVFVHKINKDPKSNQLQTIPMIQINLPATMSICKLDLRRFMWCKYVPDDNAEPGSVRDCAFHFAICQNDVVHVTNLIQLEQRFGQGTHCITDFKGYYMTVDAHSGTVMDASFAPDGTALATASKDGTVKFFQVYMIGNETPRCLYSWSPHDGRSVGKIFFLDDHNIRSSSDSQYWKYMLTAVENMSEIKLWTCKTWQCLQHIKFVAPSPTQLRMDMDVTAHYLVMGDVHRKVMFILHLSHDDESARFDWASEFSLPNSMLSFNVNSARECKDIDVPRHLTDFDNILHTLVEVYFVQSKSLQQGTVIFQTPMYAPRSNGHNRISFNNSVTVKETVNVTEEETRTSLDGDDDSASQDNGGREVTPTKSTVLLKQKSRSPSPHARVPVRVEKMTEELSNLIGLPTAGLAANVRRRSPNAARSPEILGLFASPKSVQENVGRVSPIAPNIGRTASTPGDATKTSSSSSPSREVEEIMSPKATNELIGRRSATSPSMEGVIRHTPLLNDGEFSQEENDHESPLVLKNIHTPTSNIYSPYTSPNNAVLAQEIPQMPQILEQVSSIMEMMKAQALEMQELKREVNYLSSTQSKHSRHEEERTLEKYLSHSQSQFQRIEESMKTLEIIQRQHTHQNNNPLPSNIAEILATSIGQIVKTEIETSVLPSMISLFEPTRIQIKLEADKMIAATEARLKQDIRLMIQNDSFTNAVTSEVKASVKPVFEGALMEIFRNTLIPGVEKALQNVLLQINESFMKGTRDYLAGMQASAEAIKNNDKTEEILNHQFVSMQDNLTSTLQVEMESQMLRVIQSLQGGLVKQMEEIFSRELARSFRDQQKFLETSVVPRSSTPALSVCSEQLGPDPIQLQKQLMGMVNSGDISGAFTLATNQTNLSLLMYLCNKVPPNKVFTIPPSLPLQTHMLMIQQMAAELVGHTEVKLNYLQAAISTLDLTDRRVVQSISRIVPIFQGSIKKFTTVNPDSKLTSNIRLLEMALYGIGGKYHQSFNSSNNDIGQNSTQSLFAFGPGNIKHEN
ncbi:unnamed protein product [Allacma fusca]|uniref:Enhancer of mRNA-decapping protein 4 WD40 repeat region domain-containing protein n=1 Tax=Allacma fusca TaxID=39272 RepID=A0A8J2JEM3_9HEXA|nr:unnamed protein product [Allacma fusca]